MCLKPKNLSEKKIQEILSTSSKLGLKNNRYSSILWKIRKFYWKKNFQNLNKSNY